MSNATTRSQYVYIEVKHDASPKSIILYGPDEVLCIIQHYVTCDGFEVVGNFKKIHREGNDIMLLKGAFVEEVLKCGFAYDSTSSRFKDDFIVFSRQVKL